MTWWNESGNYIAMILRFILGGLDWIVYVVVEFVFDIMFDISKVNPFGDTIIKEFSERVYLILGIFMIFKLTISMLNAVVNPDKLTDKEVGVGKMITRIMLSLIMLVSVSAAFQISRDVQDIFLPVIPKIVMGVANDETLKNNSSKIGKNMSLTTYRAFVGYNEACVAANPSWSTEEGDGSIGGKYLSGSALALAVTEKCPNQAVFKYNYFPIVSLLIGGFLAWVLIGFCIDVAIRVFKLGVLQLIAPIPIISYIDPKGGKDGAFSTWIKSCTSTYIDLFMKLAIMYFAVFMIGQIVENKDTVMQGITNPFVLVFILVGLFQFAKIAPKFIMDAMGIKGGDGGFLGKFAKSGGKFAFNKTAGAGLNTLAGMAGGGYAGLSNGGFKGAWQGMKFGARSGFKNGWDGKSGSFLETGNKVLQNATGRPDAKMGILGKSRWVDDINSNTGMKYVKAGITNAADTHNEKNFEKIAAHTGILDPIKDKVGKTFAGIRGKEYNDGKSSKELIEAQNNDINAIKNLKLSESEESKRIANIKADYSSQIREKYTAGSRRGNKLEDISSVKQNRNDSKKNADQAKIWAQAIKDAQKGGGPAPGAPDKK